MMSRRKQQALEHARGSPEEGRLKRARAGRLNRAPLRSAGEPQPPGPARAEEICLDKTPKRLSRSNQWSSTFSSPNNDELQQEIFWDPQSPTPYKSENERRKRAGKCGVEISDIVNRIAPQDEKPTSSEVALLGMWIGENAIPCTPGVGTVRTRAKISGNKHKIKNTEEELMKLAKQFDQNLVDAIQEQEDQNQTEIVACRESFNNGGVNEEINDSFSLPDELPEGHIARSMHAIEESTGMPTIEQYQNSSQKSLDQEAEAAFNALFDSSTQKCSGRLSQGLSYVSQKSSPGISSLSETKKDINLHTTKRIQHGDNISDFKLPSVTLFLVEDQIHTPETVNISNVPKQNVAPDRAIDVCSRATPVSTSRDDFDDDWGTDLLEDDSFIMQITQNPELIKTPQNNLTLSKLSRNTPISSDDSKSIVPHGHSMSLSSKANHFQFQPSKSCKDTSVANAPSLKSVYGSDYSTVDCKVLQTTDSFKTDHMCTSETSTQNKAPKLTSQIYTKPEVKKEKESVQSKHVPSVNVTQTGLCSNLKGYQKPNSLQSGNYNQNTNHRFSFSLAGSSSQNKSSNLGKTAIQANNSKQNHASLQSKDSDPSDDWTDPKFSEEMLDLFCGSDSLFEANEEEDDLLYQVCDDIEKLTQTEDIKQDHKKNELMQHGNVVCKSDAKPVQSYQFIQNTDSNQNTFSVLPNSWSTNQVIAQEHISSAHLETPTSKLPLVSKPMISLNCKPVISGHKTNDCQGKFNRSNSTPAEGFRCFSLAHSQNNVKPLSSSSMNKAPVAPPPAKFTFTKIKTSQLTAIHVDQNSSRSESETRRQDGVSKTQSNISLHGNMPVNQRPTLKKQLSESFLQSARLLTAEERRQKCSQEEIDRKKREALERRKKRTQSLQQDR